MNIKHTPTPWLRNIPPAAKYSTIFSGRNTHVLRLVSSGLPEDEVEANCEFLLRAVNSHAALVEALETGGAMLMNLTNKLRELGNTQLLQAAQAEIRKTHKALSESQPSA